MRGKDTFLFRMEGSFHSLKYSNLLGDFSAYFGYVLLAFHFVVYCNSEHFKIFSNWNSNVFTMKLGLHLGFSHYNCLVLWSVSSHAVLLIPLIVMGKICINHFFNFLRCTLGKRYLRVVSVRWRGWRTLTWLTWICVRWCKSVFGNHKSFRPRNQLE